ncbi:non-ribosomal peptide synthetase, partial [Thauera sinica]
AGGAYVPLDPAYPGERLAYMLEDCEPGVILTDGGLEAELQTLIAIAAARHEPALPVLDLRQDGAWRALPEDAVTVAGLRPHHLAYVIYTSGSTGRPKGVMIEQRSLNNLIGWHIERFGLEAGSRSSCTAGVAFDACAWETWPVLAAGGTLLLAPAASEGDPQALLAWWQSQALDVSFLVTPLAEHALAHGQANDGVRSLLIGGDRLRRWPSGLPSGQALVNNYGPTENTVVASSGTLSADGVLHIGRPIGNTRIYILDGHGQPVPIGVAGELYIGGDGVARGYLNQPELTAERFVADPFAAATAGNPAPRMYRTGDLGRWLADGTIEYLGRNDFQVKVRGFRIELGEIEAHLAQAADVSDVVVIARADGDTDTQHLVAYYVGEAAADALRTHAGDGLPSYMVPSAFVRLARLPLTPNGKLDRAALPAPEGDAFVRRGYEAPQGEVEQTLARLWSELLGVAQVGRHDNFFELGGHSLLAVQ